MTVAASGKMDDRAPSALPTQAAAEIDEAAAPATSIAGLETFSAQVWEGVAPSRRTPMQQWIWVRAAAETLSPLVPVRVLSVGPATQPLALAALTPNLNGVPRLNLLGAEEISESVEVPYRTESALEALAQGLASTGLPLRFGHYLADTPLVPALRRAYRGRGLVVAKPLPARGCPSITLDPSWIEPESHFNRRRRSDFRRMQRAAEQLGAVSHEIIAPMPDQLAAMLDDAMAVEAQGWKGRAGTAMAHDERLARFYRRYAELACEAGILRLCFLRIGGRAAAMQLAVETENRFWLFKIGYDETFKRCSPGNLLLRETIRHAAERGLQSFEFLGKEAAWTTLWTDAARPLVALRTYPYNLAGAAALAGDAGRALLQRLVHTSLPFRRPLSEGASHA